MDPAKWQNISNVQIKHYLKSGSSENRNLNQVIIQRELESINLSSRNGTFVTKGEIESNLLTTHTDKPKLNHWVHIMLNQIGIQLEASSLYFKSYFPFHLFSQLKKMT